MDLVEVKIKCTVVTSRYGSLQAGDIVRTDAEFARHLVEDCAAAEFLKGQINEPTLPNKSDPNTPLPDDIKQPVSEAKAPRKQKTPVDK